MIKYIRCLTAFSYRPFVGEKAFFHRKALIMADLCEALMILLFGLSWPTSILKSIRSRTAKGKTPLFEILILLGYVFGIIRKFIQLSEYRAAGTTPGFLFWFAWIFYFINMSCIIVDLILYVRNARLDKKRDAGEKVD